MQEDIIEGVCLDFIGHPLIKCWESAIPNIWYSDNSESAFILTAFGFKLCLRAKTKQQYLMWRSRRKQLIKEYMEWHSM